MRLARSHAPFVAFAAVGTAIIALTVAMYPTSVRQLVQPGSWVRVLSLALLPLLGVVAAAWLARLMFVLSRAARTVGRLPRIERLPARLRSCIARAGVERVQCISSGLPIAFCAGA